MCPRRVQWRWITGLSSRMGLIAKDEAKTIYYINGWVLGDVFISSRNETISDIAATTEVTAWLSL